MKLPCHYQAALLGLSLLTAGLPAAEPAAAPSPPSANAGSAAVAQREARQLDLERQAREESMRGTGKLWGGVDGGALLGLLVAPQLVHPQGQTVFMDTDALAAVLLGVVGGALAGGALGAGLGASDWAAARHHRHEAQALRQQASVDSQGTRLSDLRLNAYPQAGGLRVGLSGSF